MWPADDAAGVGVVDVVDAGAGAVPAVVVDVGVVVDVVVLGGGEDDGGEDDVGEDDVGAVLGAGPDCVGVALGGGDAGVGARDPAAGGVSTVGSVMVWLRPPGLALGSTGVLTFAFVGWGAALAGAGLPVPAVGPVLVLAFAMFVVTGAR